MNISAILEIISLALGVAQNAASGTKAAGDIATITALEQMAAKIAKVYQEESGQPLDLDKLTNEELIP